MLLELSVARIALIESLELKFEAGLCVFTGETGAGKSILLDAIGLLLGNRASVELIRSGSDDAVVEALFALDTSSRSEVVSLLTQWGMDTDGESLVVSRRLYRSGRTVCRINGQLATVQMLRELGTHLVQQHGQHESQSLLRPDEQLRLLDAFAGHEAQVQKVKTMYHVWREATKQLENAALDEQERARRLDMLQFQMGEIAAAKLVVGEEEELREQHSRLLHVEKISEAIEQAVEFLDGATQLGAVSQVTEAVNAVNTVLSYDTNLKPAIEMLDTAQVHLDEATRELSAFMNRLEADPQRLAEMDDRLALIRSLERKYGPTIEAVMEYYQEIEAEYEQYQNRDEELRRLTLAVHKTQKDLEDATCVLHNRRVKSAKVFANRLGDVLKHLQMPNAAFQILVTERRDESGMWDYGPTGADAVTFLFTANKGTEPKPLQKIASGGELSRTMLSIKSVMANIDDVNTLIFDEIDAGVSGSAAQRVAEQLLQLGQSRQVLCVTHSPQIAAAGKAHYFIQKRDRALDTITEVQPLNQAGRTAEVARLLGSDVADDTAHRHAQAMLASFGPN